ncbi:MAG: biotin/lipoate A/B protein ligase family protein [Pirellulaceae bacterium]
MPRVRLMIDPPAAGPWNMAVDEALLRATPQTGMTTLRFYQWAEPTLSLGYFQHHADRSRHVPSLDAPWLRRASGGGAILHDHELTYSLTVPVRDTRASNVADYFDHFHQSLIQTLRGWGIQAALNGDASLEGLGSPPFLCFLRRSPVDVILNSAKICGSAQRRHTGAMLQHGSVLLSRSPHAPELAGINDLVQLTDPLSVEDLRTAWLEELSRLCQFSYDKGVLATEEAEASRRLATDRFRANSWNERR